MKFFRRFVFLLTGMLALQVLCGCGREKSVRQFPRKPIKVVVPFDPGGGSDTLARHFQKTIKDAGLLPVPIEIVNSGGAGGTIGSRRVKNAKPDGYTILFLHEGILTAKHSGSATYGPEAFTPIAATGEVGAVVAVAADSKFSDLTGLAKAMVDEPDTITFAANLGSPSDFWARLLEKEIGGKFRIVQSGGGAARYKSIIGGHIEVTIFSVSEFENYKSDGDGDVLRALAYLGGNRHPAFLDLPTAKEQGVDVVSGNIQGWWAPKGTPVARVAFFADVLKRAMATPAMEEIFVREQIRPVFLSGDSLAEDLKSREAKIAAVGTREQVSLPNLMAVFGVIGLVALGLSFFQKRGADEAKPGLFDDPTGLFRGASLVLITIAFAAALQGAPFGFQLTAVLFLFFAFRLLNPSAMGLGRVKTIVVSLAIPLAVHWIFTQVVRVDLP